MGRKSVWTLDKCLESASKYYRPIDWKKNDFNAYRAALNHGWKDECYKNFINKWTLQKCVDDAKNYKNITDWKKNSSSAYRASVKNNWKDKIFEKVFKDKTNIKPSGYWTYEKCKQEALKYKSRTQWKKCKNGSLHAAKKMGWYDECTAHMVKLTNQESAGYWTYEKCKQEALKHNRPTDWSKNSVGSYQAARKMGWYEELKTHMTIRKTKPNTFWHNKQNCLEDAKKYTSKIEWYKNSTTAYTTAKKMGWYEECIIPFYSHEEAKIVKKFYDLSEEIKLYSSEKEWIRKNVKSYNLAKKLDLYEVLIVNANFNVDDLVLEFDMLKLKLLEYMNFETFSDSTFRKKFKKEFKEKTSELILSCNKLIKYTYE
jgi:hypothetical protein